LWSWSVNGGKKADTPWLMSNSVVGVLFTVLICFGDRKGIKPVRKFAPVIPRGCLGVTRERPVRQKLKVIVVVIVIFVVDIMLLMSSFKGRLQNSCFIVWFLTAVLHC